MNKFLIFLIVFTLLLILIAYYQTKQIEQFTSNINDSNKLYIKKTNQYTKIYNNKKYYIWMPENIDDYYPTGVLLTKNKNPPKILSTLVKNEYGENSKDKPEKYEIVSITNNNFAFWRPIASKEYNSLGVICSREYPSKYLIRCVPNKFTKKTNIVNKLISNSLKSSDKGYELWSLNNSNNIIVNNLNNIENLDNLKNIYRLNHSKCTTEKKLYMKYTTTYEKVVSYKDPKSGNSFYVWKPKPPKNFCVIGYICLTKKTNPNNKLKTIVVHKSCCKPPLNYGKQSLINLNKDDEENSVSFWRPQPQKNFCCLGDIVVVGDKEPQSDNLIHCVSLDYVDDIKNGHNMVWNNIDSNKSASIWINKNNMLHFNNGYTDDNFNNYVLNNNLFTSDNDLLDTLKILKLNFRANKQNEEKIGTKKLEKLIVDTLTSKIDIHKNRIKDINIEEDFIELSIDSRKSGSSELNVKDAIKKLKNILDNGDIKIFNEEKNNFYIIIDNFEIKNLDNNNVIIDNSNFLNKYN